MQKKNFSMQFLIFFCYELSVCPLILKSDKVYFLSSLIAKPNLEVVILEIKNPTFVFWEKLWLNNLVSRLTDH